MMSPKCSLFILLSLFVTQLVAQYTGTCETDADCLPNDQQTCSDFGYCQGPNKEWQCPNGQDSECPRGWFCDGTGCAIPRAGGRPGRIGNNGKR